MVADDRSSGQLLYHELGFSVPPLVSEISKTATADWSAVSLEKLAELDADYLILVNSDQGADFLKTKFGKILKRSKKEIFGSLDLNPAGCITDRLLIQK